MESHGVKIELKNIVHCTINDRTMNKEYKFSKLFFNYKNCNLNLVLNSKPK